MKRTKEKEKRHTCREATREAENEELRNEEEDIVEKSNQPIEVNELG